MWEGLPSSSLSLVLLDTKDMQNVDRKSSSFHCLFA